MHVEVDAEFPCDAAEHQWESDDERGVRWQCRAGIIDTVRTRLHVRYLVDELARGFLSINLQPPEILRMGTVAHLLVVMILECRVCWRDKGMSFGTYCQVH